MLTVVPESAAGAHGQDDRARALGEALDGLLEFTGAAAGWVGLFEPDGHLTFPVRRGTFPDAWLSFQQARGSVWGFEVREGCTLLNDLQPLPPLGEPPLSNLLSCPLGPEGPPRGHVVLANKPNGFTSHDAAVLQGVGHLMYKQLARAASQPRPTVVLPSLLLRRALDRVGEGVLAVDETGTLAYANGTWLRWTEFAAEEVIGSLAPFPFWVSHRELAAVAGMPSGLPAGLLPFRRRNQSLFWCQVESAVEEVEGRRLTIAFLRQAPAPNLAGPEKPQPVALPLLIEDLPFGVALTDRQGRLFWTNAALSHVAPPQPGQGPLLRDRFVDSSAAALERLFRDPRQTEAGRMGRLFLQTVAGEPIYACWLAIGLPDGPGFLFALTDDAEGFPLAGEEYGESRHRANPPAVDWLVLLLQPGEEIGYWSERWEELTGLTAADLGGVRSELVLDWLFPRQHDRDLVADWFNQSAPRGGQAILEVLTPAGSQPLLCTLLPVAGSDLVRSPSAQGRGVRWLLLVGEPETFLGTAGPSLAFVRQFTRGLVQLLNHYLTIPIGLSEMALDREGLPAETAAWFGQIHESCQRATRLIEALEDLSAQTAGETHLVPLAALVREFLDEQAAPKADRPYELSVDLREDQVPVRVNRRMMRVVLRHLFRNAEQAVANSPRRQIDVRVAAGEEVVRCEIHDTGEGLPTDDWTLPLTPFFSTKGAFAHDAVHAAQEATGLGLTVSQHLLLLHGGHLELRGGPGEGTTAAIVLPRGDRLPRAAATDSAKPEALRADAAAGAGSPHAKEEWSATRERPDG
jgi:signal transduction histidine kinase